MRPFTVAAQLIKIQPLVDRGLSIGFHTKELKPQEQLEALQYFQQAGWLLFSPDPLQEQDIPENPSEYEERTPSQRLRGALYRLWEQEGKQGDFEVYYRGKMEKFIIHVKSKLG